MFLIPHPQVMTVLAGVFVGFLAFSNLAVAQSRHDALPYGPKIGAAVGSILAGAIDQDGKRQSLKTLQGKKGLILLFSRSFDW
jgi:hypothetical protein